jgi:hypothetical protein
MPGKHMCRQTKLNSKSFEILIYAVSAKVVDFARSLLDENLLPVVS